MKAKCYKARIWEIEWENHFIRVESSENTICPSRLYIDGKIIAEGKVFYRNLRGFIQEDAEGRRCVECFFTRRSVWLREIKILRRKNHFFARMLGHIWDMVGSYERIEVQIFIDGEAIYHSLFGNQEKIQKVNEILEEF